MPAALYTIKTELGEFASMPKAAAAHKCSVATIHNRITSDPDHYQKIPKPPKPPKVKYSTTAKTTWPMTWAQYKYLSFEVKEEIWLGWCRANKKNPDLDETVDEFYDIMDATQETQNAQQQVV